MHHTLYGLIFATTISVINGASAAPSYKPVTITQSIFVCDALDDARIWLGVAQQGDAEAMTKFRKDRQASGRCRWIYAYSEVFKMKQVTIGKDTFACFRAKGEAECGWDADD